MILPVVLVLLGAFSGAWSAVFIRFTSLPPVLLAAYRLLFAAAALTPVFFREIRRHGISAGPDILRPVLLPGFFLALHFIGWNMGVRYTSVANSSLIVNMTPAAMPIIVFLLYRERPSGRELLGTLLALAGTAVLAGAFLPAGSGFLLSSDNSPGDLISFAAMVLFAAYLALAKRSNRATSVWIYVVPLYFWAGLLCLGFSFFVSPPWSASHGPADIAMALALALVCTVGGHSLLNYGMRVLKSQFVSLLVVTQALWAPLLGYLFFGEIPGPAFLPAAILVGAGIVLAVFRKASLP